MKLFCFQNCSDLLLVKKILVMREKLLNFTAEKKIEITRTINLNNKGSIEIKNNKARHNLSNVKYRQMAFQSVDGTVVGNILEPLHWSKKK